MYGVNTTHREEGNDSPRDVLMHIESALYGSSHTRNSEPLLTMINNTPLIEKPKIIMAKYTLTTMSCWYWATRPDKQTSALLINQSKRRINVRLTNFSVPLFFVLHSAALLHSAPCLLHLSLQANIDIKYLKTASRGPLQTSPTRVLLYMHPIIDERKDWC